MYASKPLVCDLNDPKLCLKAILMQKNRYQRFFVLLLMIHQDRKLLYIIQASLYKLYTSYVYQNNNNNNKKKKKKKNTHRKKKMNKQTDKADI